MLPSKHSFSAHAGTDILIDTDKPARPATIQPIAYKAMNAAYNVKNIYGYGALDNATTVHCEQSGIGATVYAD